MKNDDRTVRLIGISGRMRSGKDSVASMLKDMAWFQRLAFADPLKAAAKVIFGWTDEHVYGALKDVVDPRWGFSPRWALQKMGTEAMRGTFGADIWVRAGMNRFRGLVDDEGVDNVVFTDVRFPEEADAVKAAGGVVWRIERPSLVVTGDEHVSETAMDDYGQRRQGFDAVIINNGTLAELRDMTRMTAIASFGAEFAAEFMGRNDDDDNDKDTGQ